MYKLFKAKIVSLLFFLSDEIINWKEEFWVKEKNMHEKTAELQNRQLIRDCFASLIIRVAIRNADITKKNGSMDKAIKKKSENNKKRGGCSAALSHRPI